MRKLVVWWGVSVHFLQCLRSVKVFVGTQKFGETKGTCLTLAKRWWCKNHFGQFNQSMHQKLVLEYMVFNSKKI